MWKGFTIMNDQYLNQSQKSIETTHICTINYLNVYRLYEISRPKQNTTRSLQRTGLSSIPQQKRTNQCACICQHTILNISSENSHNINTTNYLNINNRGAQWLSGRVLDSRPSGRGFEPLRRHCVVSMSKTHQS